ncbi:MAG TPA: M48 family metalloprotease [Gemmatimonadota bacterium]|nr:M48 family metalloprotease [Gemmatimonadota bacterium]
MKKRLFAPLILTYALTLVGCPVNPATGERQLILVSEREEIQMGLQGAQQVEQIYGLYDDADLQAYVEEIGQELAAASEKPGLPWHFKVIDDPIVNAFALPGGQIFMTRGILSYFTSEAEMAAVLGHEIGHVTARHSAEQMSRASVAGLGLGVGAILSSDIAKYAGVLSQGLGLMFLKFGRDDERQSDDLGFRYMSRVGYNPREAADVFTMLGRVTEAAGGSSLPGWLSTHPDPDERVQRIRAALDSVEATGVPITGEVGRDRYLRRIDGIVFGQNPREGYFEEQLFLHPELAFQLEFPKQWQTQNTRQVVAGVSPESDAIVTLSLADAPSAQQALQAFLAEEAISPRGSASGAKLNGMPARSTYFNVETQDAKLAGLAVWVEYNGQVFQLLGYTVLERLQQYDQVFQRSLGSFDRVTDPAVLGVQPRRVQLVRIDRAMTIEQFAARYPSTVSAATLAIINAVEEGEEIPAGTTVKRVVGGPED